MSFMQASIPEEYREGQDITLRVQNAHFNTIEIEDAQGNTVGIVGDGGQLQDPGSFLEANSYPSTFTVTIEDASSPYYVVKGYDRRVNEGGRIVHDKLADTAETNEARVIPGSPGTDDEDLDEGTDTGAGSDRARPILDKLDSLDRREKAALVLLLAAVSLYGALSLGD